MVNRRVGRSLLLDSSSVCRCTRVGRRGSAMSDPTQLCRWRGSMVAVAALSAWDAHAWGG